MKHILKYKTDLPLDSTERTLYHKKLIFKKTFLKKLYKQLYNELLSEIDSFPNDIFIELGSGGGFLKDIEPKVITTDILDLPGNDMTFSALDMPFNNNTVGGIFMVDTFHHIPDKSEIYKVSKKRQQRS